MAASPGPHSHCTPYHNVTRWRARLRPNLQPQTAAPPIIRNNNYSFQPREMMDIDHSHCTPYHNVTRWRARLRPNLQPQTAAPPTDRNKNYSFQPREMMDIDHSHCTPYRNVTQWLGRLRPNLQPQTAAPPIIRNRKWTQFLGDPLLQGRPQYTHFTTSIYSLNEIKQNVHWNYIELKEVYYILEIDFFLRNSSQFF